MFLEVTLARVLHYLRIKLCRDDIIPIHYLVTISKLDETRMMFNFVTFLLPEVLFRLISRNVAEFVKKCQVQINIFSALIYTSQILINS